MSDASPETPRAAGAPVPAEEAASAPGPEATPTASAGAAIPAAVPVGTEQVTVRRAPKIPAFLIVGGGVGAVATFILTSLFPADPSVGFGALFGYFSLFGVTGGVLLGAILAISLDRRSIKRARVASAQISTEVKPVEVESDAESPATE
ncbi:MAG: hypothetical protein ACRCSP_07965 [Rhodoglobus sp.]